MDGEGGDVVGLQVLAEEPRLRGFTAAFVAVEDEEPATERV